MELKPGYKHTEAGMIPDDWGAKQLGAVAAYTNGKAHEKSISDYGRYVVVNSKFISSEGETRKYSDHCFCPTSIGDVLMVMSDVPNGGRANWRRPSGSRLCDRARHSTQRLVSQGPEG